MLASSWKAKGLVRDAWKRLDVKRGQREKLAELTGIPATTLSGMNTGRIPMTPSSARRIVDAVPGLSVEDLGGREAEGDEPSSLSIPEQVAAHDALLAELVEGLAKMTRKVTRLQARVARLEDQRGQQPGAESGS